MKTVDKFSEFNIIASNNLSIDDKHVLTLFYKPLIKDTAYSLYLLFSGLLERNNLESVTLTHNDLFDLTSYSEEVFLNARHKLEAVGLLKTYFDSVSYVYAIKAPFTPKEFLTDGTLGLYLYTEVGEKMFNFLRNKFKVKKLDKDSYKDITIPFDQVFESEPAIHFIDKKDSYILGKNKSQGTKVINLKFNFEEFLEGFNQKHLQFGLNDGFKNEILSLAHVYGYDEGDMIVLANTSLNKAGWFDYKVLKNQASSQFLSIYDTRPKLKEKELLEENPQIQEITNMSAMDILRKHNPKFTEKDQNTTTRVYTEINLPKEVINFLYDKALLDTSGSVQHFNFYKTIADSWIRQQITNVKRAYEFVNNIKENKIKRTRTTSSKKSPDWVEEKVKNLRQGVKTL